MEQRGRKKSTLSVVNSVPRQAPSAGLTEFEAGIWHRVVNSKPADWFGPEHLEMLESYCRHCSQAASLDRVLANFDPKWAADDEGLRRWQRLQDMREKQTRAINALARSMRLTQQSQYDQQAARTANKRGKGGKKLWEDV